jgi:dihydrofolate reductase
MVRSRHVPARNEVLAMRTINVIERLSLDGVMQAPGDPNEDTRGGFELGGWGNAYNDDVIGAEMSKGMGTTELLLGRRTYEILHDAWADRHDPNPFTKVLNDTPKHVVSSSLKEPLEWENSTVLDGDAAKSVARLKKEPGKDLAVIGSGVLVGSLLEAGLVDELTLLIHPLVLGSGRKLFDGESSMAKLTLTDSVTSPTGVVIATYAPA